MEGGGGRPSDTDHSSGFQDGVEIAQSLFNPLYGGERDG